MIRLDLRCSTCGIEACYGMHDMWYCYSHRPAGFLPTDRRAGEGVGGLQELTAAAETTPNTSPSARLPGSARNSQLELF